MAGMESSASDEGQKLQMTPRKRGVHVGRGKRGSERYRQSCHRSYKRKVRSERRKEAGAADSDVIFTPRGSGVHWELVGPIPAAMQTSSYNVCFSEKVKKFVTEGCSYGREMYFNCADAVIFY